MKKKQLKKLLKAVYEVQSANIEAAIIKAEAQDKLEALIVDLAEEFWQEGFEEPNSPEYWVKTGPSEVEGAVTAEPCPYDRYEEE